MSKGSQRRPTLISRELEELRWQYAMQKPPMTFSAVEGLEKEGIGISLRYEQYWAIKRSHRYIREQFDYWVGLRNRFWRIGFLRRYFQTKVDRAYWCLRHFPLLYKSGQPRWSKDEFTEDVE
jgi:hypothetical protein